MRDLTLCALLIQSSWAGGNKDNKGSEAIVVVVGETTWESPCWSMQNVSSKRNGRIGDAGSCLIVETRDQLYLAGLVAGAGDGLMDFIQHVFIV